MKIFGELLRNAEGGGSTAAAAGGAETTAAATTSAGSAATAGATGTTQAETSASPTIYRPEGLPDHLIGASEKETVDKLWGAYKGARDKIAGLGEVPADPTAYTFEASDKVKPYAETLSDDPFFNTAKGVFHKHGLSNKAFQGVIGDLMEAMIDGNIVAEPFSPAKERAALVPDIADPKAQAEAADRIVRENAALVESWAAQGLDASVVTFLKSSLDRAAANKLVDFIRDSRGEQRPALGEQRTSAAGLTEADLDRRMSDPRNTKGDPNYDRGFAAETDRLFKAFYGN